MITLHKYHRIKNTMIINCVSLCLWLNIIIAYCLAPTSAGQFDSSQSPFLPKLPSGINDEHNINVWKTQNSILYCNRLGAYQQEYVTIYEIQQRCYDDCVQRFYNMLRQSEDITRIRVILDKFQAESNVENIYKAIDEIALIFDTFKDWKSNLLAETIKRLSVADLLVLAEMFKGWPMNKVLEALGTFEHSDIDNMTHFFKLWPSELVYETVNRLRLLDIKEMVTFFQNWPKEKIQYVVKNLKNSDIHLFSVFFKDWPKNTTIEVFHRISVSDIKEMEKMFKGWPSELVQCVVDSTPVSDIKAIGAFFKDWPIEKVQLAVNHITLSQTKKMVNIFKGLPREKAQDTVKDLSESDIVKISEFFENWPLNLKEEIVNHKPVSDIKDMAEQFKGWPPQLIYRVVDRSSVSDFKIIGGFFKDWPLEKVQNTIKHIPKSDIKDMVEQFKGWPSKLVQQVVEGSSVSHIKVIGAFFKDWPKDKIQDMVDRIPKSDIKFMAEQFKGWPPQLVQRVVEGSSVSDIRIIEAFFKDWRIEIIQDTLDRIAVSDIKDIYYYFYRYPPQLVQKFIDGSSVPEIRVMGEFFKNWQILSIQYVIKDLAKADIIAMAEQFKGWPPQLIFRVVYESSVSDFKKMGGFFKDWPIDKVQGTVSRMPKSDIKVIVELFKEWPSQLVQQLVEGSSVSEIKAFGAFFKDWPIKAIQDVFNRLPLDDIKSMTLFFRDWPTDMAQDMAKPLSESDIKVMSDFFNGWPVDMVQNTMIRLPIANRRTYLETMLRYAHQDWWKKLFACNKLKSIFESKLPLDHLLQQISYKELLTNYVEFFSQNSGSDSVCSDDILIEILNFDSSRETRLGYNDFFNMLNTLCNISTSVPLESLKELLNDPQVRSEDMDTVYSLLKQDISTMRAARKIKQNAQDWSLKTILSELARCGGDNDCIQLSEKAIITAQSIGLKPDVFIQWLEKLESSGDTDRKGALSFIAALKSANNIFQQRNKYEAYLLDVLYNIEKEINRSNVDSLNSRWEINEELSPSTSSFLERVVRDNWSMSEIASFLGKSNSNHVNVNDYSAMFEVTKDCKAHKIHDVQNLFASLYIWEIGGKSIWNILKEKNINLNLPHFVNVLNKNDVCTLAALINFFTNENLAYCDANTVLQVAYYSKALNYALTETQYKTLYNEACTSDEKKMDKLINIIKAAKIQNLPYDELLYKLVSANGKQGIRPNEFKHTVEDSGNTWNNDFQGGIKYQTFLRESYAP